MINLDTHVLLFAIDGKLRNRERQLLKENHWSVSAIVLWEVAKLKQLGRIELDITSTAFIKYISNVHIWPIDRRVASASVRLDFRSDPADELIAATSVVHKIPLLSRDRTILNSKLVPLA